MKKEAKLRTFNWGIKATSVIFGLLFFWSLDFVLEDFRFVAEPSYKEITKEFIDPALEKKRERLDKSISQINTNIAGLEEKQRFLDKSSGNAERLLHQLLETQKVKLSNGGDLSKEQLASLKRNQDVLAQNAEEFQELNAKISDLARDRQKFQVERQSVNDTLQKQRDQGYKKYDKLAGKHRITVAFVQLLFLLPFALLAGYLVVQKRESKYRLMYYAFVSAVGVKVFFVIHQYFPSRYFKYIAIGFALLVVGRLLVLMVRNFEKPKDLFLIKQYRKAYDNFLCPVCDYTIRIGPLKFLLNRKKMAKNGAFFSDAEHKEEAYTCPSCGTGLYENCSKCKKVRHALLPHCRHCGHEKKATV